MARDDSLLTTGDVARRFKVNPSTVTRWATSGVLPCVVLPSGVRRYREVDVEELLAPSTSPDTTEDTQPQADTARSA